MNSETRVKGILRRKICYGSCHKYIQPFNEKLEIEKYEKVMKEVDNEIRELLERFETASNECVQIKEEIDKIKNKNN
jgi:hypothetical protein